MPVDDMWKYKDGSKKPGYGKGKRWRARWPNPHSTRPNAESRERFDTKAAAENHAAEMLSRVNAGDTANPRLGKMALEAVADEWLAARFGVHDRSTEKVERHLRLHIKPLLGHQPVAKVTPTMLKGWLADRSQHLKSSTLRTVWITLHSVLESAVDDGRIPRNPCDKVDAPAAARRGDEKVIPTTEQVLAIADAVPARYRAFVLIAAWTGLRLSEIAGLEPSDIGWLARPQPTVSVRRQLLAETGRVYLDDPKTEASLRTVETFPQATAALSQHMQQFPPLSIELDDETAAANPQRRPGQPPIRRTAELLFSTATGKPLRRGSLSRAFTAAIAQTGADPRITIHSLRHYYASLLFQHRVSDDDIQAAMGHSDLRITLDTYRHFRPSIGTSIGSALAAEIAGATAGEAADAGSGS